MRGADVFDVPGALTWNELTTRDVEGSAAFYGSVFGWAARETSMGGMAYIVWELDGRPIAGMQPMIDGDWPDDLPPHWMVYFAVARLRRLARASARRWAAGSSRPPTSLPIGRYAVLRRPAGRHVLHPHRPRQPPIGASGARARPAGPVRRRSP